MNYAVLVTTPRAGFGYAVAPYSVELADLYETIESAQAVAQASVMSPAVIELFDDMPLPYPVWSAGSFSEPASYPAGAYVSHGGRGWRATVGHLSYGDPNYAPDLAVSLWTAVAPPGLTAWVAGVSLLDPVEHPAPVRRTHAGRLYELVQRHVTQFEPPLVPALWQDIGSAVATPAYDRARFEVVPVNSAEYLERERAKEPA
jgi:hypothetical protein